MAGTRRSRRLVSIVAALAVTGGLATGVDASGAHAATSKPGVRSARPVTGHGVPVRPRPPDRTGAASVRHLPAPSWPAEQTASVAVASAGARFTPVGTSGVGVRPLTSVRLPKESLSRVPATPPASATVQVHGQTAARRLGLTGLVVSVRRPAGGPPAGMGLQVDYSRFAGAAGGDWASRLRLVELPACALSTPEVARCRTQTPLPSRNDVTTRTVSGAVTAPAAPSAGAAPATVLALAAGATGASGAYTATSLSPSAAWQVGMQTGDFSWSYPLRVPPAVNGPSPDLALAYNSGAIDGRVISTNNQSSWIGDGFDLEIGYVERRFIACGDDKTGSNAPSVTGDLCWHKETVSVVLNGHSGDLVKDAATGVWKLKNDDGTKVERLTGAANADVDGEHWRLTTTDGTRYYFGLEKRYATDTADTRSTWTVPVAGNQAGEPCHAATFAASFCTRAWRWNLDYVVDSVGNTMTYSYTPEQNAYGRANNASAVTYERGGFLSSIEYGERQGTEATTSAPARVLFATSERCLPAGTVTCAAGELTAATASSWPDTPFDQICATSATSCPGRIAPTFFSRKRLTGVTTQVWKGSAYADVDAWGLTQSFPATGDGTSPALWLASIAHTGKVGGSLALPPVRFTGVQLPNRVPELDPDPPLLKWRMSTIESETGGSLSVSYLPAECSRTNLPASPQTNTKRCFPAFWSPEGALSPALTYFNKYPVSAVVERDLTGGGLDVVTSYDYLGAPAYRFDDNELTKSKYRTWGQWRGYQKVRTRTGDVQTPNTAAEYTFLRGMDGDCLDTACSTKRAVTVTASTGETVTDVDRVNGFQLEQTTFNGVGGAQVGGTVNIPWVSAATATDGTDKATLLGTARTLSRTALAAGGFRTTEVQTTFDPVYGMATQVSDLGDTAAGVNDETCTRYTYARNTALNIVESVSREETVAKACSLTPSRPADVVSDARTYYDGGAFGVAPTKGLVTRTDSLSGWTTAAVYTTRATMTYDLHGRVLTAKDSLGNTSTTGYTPLTGGPVTAVAQTNALGHTNTTTLDPARGLTLAEVDANGKRTDLTYDALGRLTAVWMPGRAKATQSATMTFSYAVQATAPVAVTTRELRNNGTYTTSFAMFDGLLRPRQAQGPAEGPAGGRLVTETKYDSRGQAIAQDGPFFATGAPSTALLDVTDVQKSAHTVLQYDGAGRLTTSVFTVTGVEKWRTVTSYGGDRVTVDPPAGATPTTTITDARGRVTALRQYKGAGPSGAFDETTYAYDAKGRRASMTVAGSTWTYGYDVLGRLTTASDPDQGTSTTGYDANNRVVSATDARGKSLFYDYDALDRRTAVHDGSAAGPVLASWTFDTLMKGKLTSATRFSGGNAYVNAVTGYDDAYRPTGGSVTVPLSEGKLAGTYTTGTTYNTDGGINTITPAALPGLTNEQLRYDYDNLGQPVALGGVGTGSIVGDTLYSPFGQMLQLAMGPTFGKTIWTTNDYEDGTQRLVRTRLTRQGFAADDADLTYRYDPAGNITRISDAAPGQQQAQCYTHDYLRRLTEAWTATDGCAGAPSLAVVGGPAPYWKTWTYDAAGNRLSQVDHAATGDTTQTYTYPAATAPHPHAVQQVTTTGPAGTRLDSFAYDADGNTTTRTLAGTAQSLTWNSEGRLDKVTQGTQTTSYLYDAEGTRLIRREPGKTTLYLDNAEVTLDTATDTVSSSRYYVFNGETVAVRTSAGIQVLFDDHQGTAQIAVDGVTQAVTRRRFTPFGEARGTAVTFPGQRGFVGGVLDATTGLTHLGAREYDARLGRFVSVDPVLNDGDPQQAEGYAYANNSPVTASDPSGLTCVGLGPEDGKMCDGKWVPPPPKPKSPPPPPPPPNRSPDRGDPVSGSHTRAGTVSGNSSGGKTSASTDHAAYLAALARARAEREAQKQRLIAAGKALLKIAADEFGITAGLDCITKGDMGACGETAVNVVMSFAGGVAGKLMSKYGLPWKWKKGAELVRRLWHLGDEALGALKGWLKAGDELKQLEKCNSFVPGTKVVMADGKAKRIERIKLGDKVKATDPLTGKTRPKRVVATIIGQGEKNLVALTIGVNHGGKDRGTDTRHTITATAGHPFWLPVRGAWVSAGALLPGDQLSTPDGATAWVQSARHWSALAKVHNLTVADVHTYDVVVGTTDVLTHNCGGARFVVDSQGTATDLRAVSVESTVPDRPVAIATRTESKWSVELPEKITGPGPGTWKARTGDAVDPPRDVGGTTGRTKLGKVLGGKGPPVNAPQGGDIWG